MTSPAIINSQPTYIDCPILSATENLLILKIKVIPDVPIDKYTLIFFYNESLVEIFTGADQTQLMLPLNLFLDTRIFCKDIDELIKFYPLNKKIPILSEMSWGIKFYHNFVPSNAVKFNFILDCISYRLIP